MLDIKSQFSPIYSGWEPQTFYLSSNVLKNTQYTPSDINIPHKSRSIPHRTHPFLCPQWQTPSSSSSLKPIVKNSHPHSSNFQSGQNRNEQWVTRRAVTSFEQEAKNVDLLLSLAWKLSETTNRRGSGTFTESALSTLSQPQSYPAACLILYYFSKQNSPREALSLMADVNGPSFCLNKTRSPWTMSCCHARWESLRHCYLVSVDLLGQTIGWAEERKGTRLLRLELNPAYLKGLEAFSWAWYDMASWCVLWDFGEDCGMGEEKVAAEYRAVLSSIRRGRLELAGGGARTGACLGWKFLMRVR